MAQFCSRVFIFRVSENPAIAFLGHAPFRALNAYWVAPEHKAAHAQEENDLLLAQLQRMQNCSYRGQRLGLGL